MEESIKCPNCRSNLVSGEVSIRVCSSCGTKFCPTCQRHCRRCPSCGSINMSSEDFD